MAPKILVVLTAILGLTGASGKLVAKELKHYVYFDFERERIVEKSFLSVKQFRGAQLKYTWSELEPEKDQYDFGAIRHDLSFLTAHKKRLFTQIQDVSFSVSRKNVPKYLVQGPEYSGGANLHYVGEGKEAKPEGWIARRWDKAVRERFQKLLRELGREFDGKIEGINLPETAFDYGDREDLLPKGFGFTGYKEAIIETMAVLKDSFRKSVPLQYANFMPGEWLPEEDHGYLADVYKAAVRLGVGVGGPDLLPHKKGQMNHAYHFIRQLKGKMLVGVAVQWDNYKHIDPRTGKPVTIPDLYAFGKEYLDADYLFWCTQEPFYSQQLIPFLAE